MADPRTDSIAREAARRLHDGRAGSVGEAIRSAAEALGLHGAALPGHGRVRKHAQALSMQALGDRGYAESVRGVLRAAEEFMTVLVEAMPDADPLLVGRCAAGHVDGDVRVQVRLYTEAPIGEAVRILVEFGYGEPSFGTVNTRFGRLDRAVFQDDGIELVLTRCLPRMVEGARLDLITGRPIRTMSLRELRAVLGSE